jgi:hypothetical protein
MTLFEAYDAILALGAMPAFASRVAEMRRAFEERTGEFAPDDPWFEARSRAFWDDAVTTQGFGAASEIREALPEGARKWAEAIARAHRGLFVMKEGDSEGDTRVVRDLWSGAEFEVHAIDDATRLALNAVSAPFDARLVGSDEPARVGMLPGAVFHPADAVEPIAKVIAKARAESRTTGDVLDALLRMERGLRASARVKAAYAYRAEKLAK